MVAMEMPLLRYPDSARIRRKALSKRLLAEAGFGVMDISQAYGDSDPASLWVAPWDRHPNAAGHAMLAAAFYDALLQYLPPPADVPAGR